MANPTRTTTMPHGCTFNADALIGKAGTIRGLYIDEADTLWCYVSYTDDDGGNRSIILKPADVTLAS